MSKLEPLSRMDYISRSDVVREKLLRKYGTTYVFGEKELHAAICETGVRQKNRKTLRNVEDSMLATKKIQFIGHRNVCRSYFVRPVNGQIIEPGIPLADDRRLSYILRRIEEEKEKEAKRIDESATPLESGNQLGLPFVPFSFPLVLKEPSGDIFRAIVQVEECSERTRKFLKELGYLIKLHYGGS